MQNNTLYRHFILIILFIFSLAMAQKDTITVGIYDNPPKIFLDSAGNPKGLFPDLLDQIARKEQWHIRYVKGTWKECLNRLENGDIDILPDMAYSRKRAKRFAFTEQTVYVNWTGLFSDSSSLVHSLSSLSGKKVAVMRGSIHTEGENGIKALLSELNINAYYMECNSYKEALQAVSEGKAEVAAVNQLLGQTYSDSFSLVSSSITFNPIELKYAVSQYNETGKKQLKKIDEHLLNMKKSKQNSYPRSYEEIVTAYLSPDKKEKRSSSFFDLSKDEEEWITQNQILRVGVDKNYAPYSFLNARGEYVGIIPDLLQYIANRSALRFDIVDGLSWTEILDGAKEGNIDIIATIVQTPERTEYLNFTSPYIPTPLVIMGRFQDSTISQASDLNGRTIALVEGYSSSERVLSEHPQISPHYVNSIEEALEALSMGKADAYVGVLGTSLYITRKKGISNLKVITNYADGSNAQQLGVRKELTQLHTIMNKVISRIPETKKVQIFNKWIPVQQSHSPDELLSLTAAEKKFIEEHPLLTIGVDPNYPPIEFIDKQNNLKGVTADLLNLLTLRTGLQFDHTGSSSWAENMKLMKEGKVDVFSYIVATPERKRHLLFTKPYNQSTRMIFARKDEPFLTDLNKIAEKKVCVIEGYATVDYLKERGLLQNTIEVPNMEMAVSAVSNGEADVFIGLLLPTTFTIQSMGINNIKVIGQVPEKIELSMACRKEYPELQSILNKALATITDEEWNRMKQKWFSVTIEHKMDSRIIWRTLIGAALVLLLVLLWNRSLTVQILSRKRAEEQLRKETVLKENLTHMIIHDMRNPLQVLNSIIDLLEMTDSEDERAQYMDYIRANTAILMNMVSDVIDTEKIKDVGILIEREQTDIVTLTNSVLTDMHLIRKEIHYSLKSDKNRITILCDTVLVKRILQNLLVNSFKYTKSKITVMIHLSISDVIIEIHDDGPGVPEEFRQTIFDKFSQVPDKKAKRTYSTGLGLTFCKLAVEAHGGTIGVSPKEEGGANFWFTLPLMKQSINRGKKG